MKKLMKTILGGKSLKASYTYLDRAEFNQLRKILPENLKNQMEKAYHFTELNLDYNELYFGGNWTSLGIKVEVQGALTLIVFGYINDEEFSFFGKPLTLFVNEESNGDQQYEAHLKLLEALKKRFTGKSIKFLIESSPLLNSLLKKYPCEQLLLNRYTSDTTFGTETLRRSIRKSYKPLINSGKRNLEINIFYKESADEKIFEEFRKFHIEVAGRETRSNETWKKQFEMVQRGEAFLTLATQDKELVSGNLFLLGKEEAYYGVAVNRRELMRKNHSLGHAPLFESLLYCKELGLKEVVLGEDALASKTLKEESIDLFKQGFSFLQKTNVIHRYQLNL